jgi:hypothetical protein
LGGDKEGGVERKMEAMRAEFWEDIERGDGEAGDEG